MRSSLGRASRGIRLAYILGLDKSEDVDVVLCGSCDFVVAVCLMNSLTVSIIYRKGKTWSVSLQAVRSCEVDDNSFSKIQIN